MSILDSTGDTKTIWNPDNDVEVEMAKKQFEDFKQKGYLAFRVGDKGSKDELMKKFDSEAGKIIFVPPMKGG